MIPAIPQIMVKDTAPGNLSIRFMRLNRNFITKLYSMKCSIFGLLFLFFVLPLAVPAQQVTYSDYDKDDSREMNFEIIGKMNGNFLVYKNLRWKHRLFIYDNEMKTRDAIRLDFFPEKTLNVDCVTYPDFFYLIYQYQKNNIVHCMGVKMDANGNKLTDPVELDTTRVPYFDDNKIYSTIYSEDKQKIMVFKIQKKYEKISFVTLLFDNKLQLIRKSRQTMAFDNRSDNYREFLVDNEGNFVFTLDREPVNRDYSNSLNLVTKSPVQDTFAFHPVNLEKKFIVDLNLKIDNLNKRYNINAFYYEKNRGSVQGLFSYSWDKLNERPYHSVFTTFSDSLRSEARRDGSNKIAFDDYSIRQTIVKKDGGFLLIAEDFTSQSRNNYNSPMNRWDYYNSPYSLSPNSYYYNNPYYGNYYRPLSNFYNQNTRYFYDNILVISIDRYGKPEWNKVIQKTQQDDDDDNFMSYTTVNSGDQIHFLFNTDNKNQIISDQGISADGTIKRNPTLRSREKGYEFMTRLSKQVGARQLLIPCIYRGYICFAKVDF